MKATKSQSPRTAAERQGKAKPLDPFLYDEDGVPRFGYVEFHPPLGSTELAKRYISDPRLKSPPRPEPKTDKDRVRHLLHLTLDLCAKNACPGMAKEARRLMQVVPKPAFKTGRATPAPAI